jgi:alkaline phosphatase D
VSPAARPAASAAKAAAAAPFPLGVMAGDVTPREAVIWTQYSGRGPLKAVVTQEGSDQAVFEGKVSTSEGGYVHHPLTGLTPGATSRYWFETGTGAASVKSPAGSFRTAPAEDSLEIVTFGATSCTDVDNAPFRTLKHAASQPLDFFVRGGDNVYADGARTKEEYRQLYAETWAVDGAPQLGASCATYATWDDHEVFNNWNPEKADPAHVGAALQAFFDHMPLQRDSEHPERIWRSYQWGKAAEVFVLDSRSERRPSTRERSEAQYLSTEQFEWLKQGLKDSPSVFKFVVSSVPIGDFPHIFDLDKGDRWEGYPAQRRELLDFIHKNGLTGVWFISGDFHFGAAGRVGREGTRDHRIHEVLVGPGAKYGNPLQRTVRQDGQREFVTRENNYVMFRADPVRQTLDVTFHGPRGEKLFTRRYDADGQELA